LVEHDLFGKPVSTFPDHALKGGNGPEPSYPMRSHCLIEASSMGAKSLAASLSLRVATRRQLLVEETLDGFRAR
jgi:hypothetical protein